MSHHFAGLRAVIDVLLASLPDVLLVLVLCFFFLYIFSLFCLSFFKGQLKSCAGESFDDLISQTPGVLDLLTYPKPWVELTPSQQQWFGPSNPSTNATLESCGLYDWPLNPCCAQYSSSLEHPTSRQICECLGFSWDSILGPLGSFDDIQQGFFTILQISTLSSWGQVMYAATQVNGIDMEPVRDNQIAWVFFFILLILVCGFLSFNMFIGVLCDNYTVLTLKKTRGGAILTPEQQEWFRTQEILMRIKPMKVAPKPDHAVMGKMYELNESKWFICFEQLTIMLSVLAFSVTAFGDSHQKTAAIAAVNVFCSIVFWIFLLLKILGHREHFFYDSLNLVDLIMCVLGDAFVLHNALNGTDLILIPTGIVRLIRLPKMYVLFDMFKNEKGPANMFRTLVLTIPGIFNVGLVLFLLVFIFTTMGMQIFSKVAFYENYNDSANFRSFWSSFLTMIEIATLQNWSNYMDSVAHR